jgi:hypothetical protein
MEYKLNEKRKEITLKLNRWDLELISGLINYELGNTDGWSNKEYDRMDELIKQLNNLKYNFNKEQTP